MKRERERDEAASFFFPVSIFFFLLIIVVQVLRQSFCVGREVTDRKREKENEN